MKASEQINGGTGTSEAGATEAMQMDNIIALRGLLSMYPKLATYGTIIKKSVHHDNASCHTSAETTRFLEGQKIELTGHPPFSPDLVPNDLYLFPSVRNKIRDQLFRAAKSCGSKKMPSMRS
ncbi:hypothetical protein EVAR_94866_1 [Eumeta japonica]|uniref:Mariner Mos1 transposase n=1 Tax=Eumeta variegata TaxID=151549 RepID=A0A4C1VCR9_EUMVA|nr:hypothetical protein EVAR_94866_1 [Eumeta japonica]